jgi:hypothetical protein
VIEAAMLLATALIHFALTDAGDQGVTGDATRALNMLDGDSWIAWNSAFGVMMLGAGATVFTSALPRWMGWLAIALGVLLFIPFADFFALLVTMIERARPADGDFHRSKYRAAAARPTLRDNEKRRAAVRRSKALSRTGRLDDPPAPLRAGEAGTHDRLG